MEKSLSLIRLHHKSHSPTAVLLTCVHFLLHNDQTQLQPAALRLYLSTHLGASGLCLLRYWKGTRCPSFSTSVTFICPLQFLFTSCLPFVPPPAPSTLIQTDLLTHLPCLLLRTSLNPREKIDSCQKPLLTSADLKTLSSCCSRDKE